MPATKQPQNGKQVVAPMVTALFAFFAVLGLAFGSPDSVRAQAGFTRGEAPGWLEDRDRTEGRGIRLGQLELHPGIGVEGGYDNNVFFASADPQSSFLLRVTPHLYVSTLSEERRGQDDSEAEPGEQSSVQFRAGLSASYFQYFSSQARSNVGADADVRLTLGAGRPFSFTLFESFGRTVRPFTELGAANRNYARDQNNAGVELGFGTRGNVFRGTLSYDLGYDFFEGDSFQAATSLEHGIGAGWSWRFFPQTAFLYDLDVKLTSYPNESAEGPLLSGNTRIRTRLGVNGALTQRFSLLAMVGYGVGLYQTGDDYESVVGQLELRFRLSPQVNLSLGYDRDFFRSFIGGFYLRDQGYAEFQLLGGGAFLLGLRGSVSSLSYGAALDASGDPLGAGGTSDRSDVRAAASVFAEYRASDWLGFNATLSYSGLFTDWEDTRTVSDVLFIDPASYDKVELWVGARAFY